MALEGDQVGLENLVVDQSDTTVTFPNCPDIAREFFQPQRTSTKKPDKSINEKVQEHMDRYDEYMRKQQRGVTIYGKEASSSRSMSRSSSTGTQSIQHRVFQENRSVVYFLDIFKRGFMRGFELVTNLTSKLLINPD